MGKKKISESQFSAKNAENGLNTETNLFEPKIEENGLKLAQAICILANRGLPDPHGTLAWNLLNAADALPDKEIIRFLRRFEPERAQLGR